MEKQFRLHICFKYNLLALRKMLALAFLTSSSQIFYRFYFPGGSKIEVEAWIFFFSKKNVGALISEKKKNYLIQFVPTINTLILYVRIF